MPEPSGKYRGSLDSMQLKTTFFEIITTQIKQLNFIILAEWGKYAQSQKETGQIEKEENRTG